MDDDDSEHKKAEGTKKCVIKRGIMLRNYTDCLFNDKTILKPHQRLKVIITMYTLNKSIGLR